MCYEGGRDYVVVGGWKCCELFGVKSFGMLG